MTMLLLAWSAQPAAACGNEFAEARIERLARDRERESHAREVQAASELAAHQARRRAAAAVATAERATAARAEAQAANAQNQRVALLLALGALVATGPAALGVGVQLRRAGGGDPWSP